MTKILVVEDAESLREEIIETLECEGFITIAASNGREGIERARREHPDLIVCDVMMPELDGYATLQALRQDPATATIPFVFLTARSEKTSMRQGMELGADDYLTKPFTTAELIGTISARLQKKQAIEARMAAQIDALRSSISLSLPHELRTPLNGILGFAELLMETPEIQALPDVREMVCGIYDSAKVLHRVTQKFLLYAELEVAAASTGAMKLTPYHKGIPIALAELQPALKETAERFGRASDLQLLLPTPLPVVYGRVSAAKLYRTIDELVDNAFKYSDPGTAVEVKLSLEPSSDGRRLRVSVTDRGRGMTPEQIESIGAYMQFERKLYEQQGSGLGLAIAKRVAQLCGGDLAVESEPGQHTTVRLELPLAA